MKQDYYSHLPRTGLKCPYCQNKEKKTGYFKDFEHEGMSGHIWHRRNGYWVYKESWLCINCERMFDVEITLNPTEYKVKFKRG